MADQPWMNGASEWGVIGGASVDRGPITVEGASDSTIYRTERYGQSGYGFHLPRGKYRVRLFLAETYEKLHGGDRVFDIAIQGKTVLFNYDIYKETGGLNKAVVKEFIVPVDGDTLLIEFSPAKLAKIDGIEILPL